VRTANKKRRAADNNAITIGWNGLPDLSEVRTRDELKEIYCRYYPENTAKPRRVTNEVGQIWRLSGGSRSRYIAAIPLKKE